MSIYVSTLGSDSNSGSISQPVYSIDRAIYLVNKNGGNATIFIRGGYYSLSKGLNINNISNVVIRNYNDEKVTVSGGIKINSKDIYFNKNTEILNHIDPSIRENICEIDLSKYPIYDYGSFYKHGYTWISPSPLELFIDNQPLKIARWPNDGYVSLDSVVESGSILRNGQTDNRSPIISYKFDRPSRWKDPSSAWVHGVFANGYADDNLQINNVNVNKKLITFLQPSTYGLINSSSLSRKVKYRRYYFYNIIEELDSYEEYYVDQKSKKLYFLHSKNVKNIDINVSVIKDPLFSLNNTRNITIQGLNISYGRGMGMYLESTKGTLIKNCNFSNLGTVAVSLSNSLDKYNTDYRNLFSASPDKSNINTKIVSCTITNTGTGAILISGGDRKNLSSANNCIINCEMSNFSRINLFGCPAITIEGVGNKVTNCEIKNSTGQAIVYSGNNHEISFNRISEVVTEISDQGAIYTGRDPSSTGTKIYNNLFDNILSQYGSAAAVYIDDGSGGIKVYNNIFSNCGSSGEYTFGAIHVNGGSNNTFDNNYFINCKQAFSMTSWNQDKWKSVMFTPSMKKKLTSDVDIRSNTYLKQYPFLKNFLDSSATKPRVNVISNSLFYKVNTITTNKIGYKLKNTIVTQADPRYIKVSNSRTQRTQSVRTATVSDSVNVNAIKPIDISKIGLLK